ncbi:flagellar hook-associated protein FlgL [Vallitalea pronyensis]|uniref:Flagellar hook-associated protein FlgL n=1 Tax=Vallitalea pronyensis TaxID=1348613 RepID=A0A8J8MHL9_9FIRM|nr:flagellar hook-associated protein FlgL [Vallitalea pronyensis]QUI21453.1 flagellar hook-associated protein FlgL [Vallitalea pronyensis]
MRITNSMVTNNMLLNLNRNKLALSKYEQQFSTGKKIQKPSDDPIIAVRALKFRARLQEIEQYKSNISDGLSWMGVTEKSVANVIEIVKKIKELSNQGTNDPLGKDERATIVKSIEQLKDQLANEGNVDYAGRYVFSGFKTDMPLTYRDDDSSKTYTITEEFTNTDIETLDKVFKGGSHPTIDKVHRIRLGYSDLDAGVTITGLPAGITTIQRLSTDANGYTPLAGEVCFLKDTGELIFNDADKNNIANISVEYDKTNFKKNDLNPIHYFTCTDGTDTYTKKVDAITYQVSYNQNVQVNTQGSELISVDLMRDLEDIIHAVGEIKDDDSEEDNLKKDVLGDKFDKLNGLIQNHIEHIVKEQSDLGTRMNRLELTQTRLEYDKDNFEDIMSKNEDVNIAEVAIRIKSQEMIYNASLMASSKVVQTTLLDFIR